MKLKLPRSSGPLPLIRILPALVVVLFVVVILGYGLYESRRLIEGPHISVSSPVDGEARGGPVVTIEGTASNISFLTINGAQAFTDEEGRFDERLSPAVGYTVITVSAKDRFGRVETKHIRITLIPYCSLYG